MFTIGGMELIQDALSTPAKARAFLRASGDTLENRKLLREMWLVDKGIVGGQDIPVSALKFTKDDRAMVSTLWEMNVDGINQRWKVLQDIATFAKTEKGFVEGLTRQTVDEIMSESTSKTTKELTELGIEETRLTDELADLLNDNFFKLMGKGQVPLPEGSATIETFADFIINLKNPTDFDNILQRFIDKGDGSDHALRLAVLQSMTNKAGRKTDFAQLDSNFGQLWNPQLMERELGRNETNLRKLLGDDKYENFVGLNRGMDRTSATLQTKRDPLAPRFNVSGGGRLSAFFPNVYGFTADRVTKLLIWNQIKNPIDWKKMVSAEDFDRLNEATLRSFFLVGNFADLVNEADIDPDFRLWLDETYGLLQDAAMKKGVQMGTEEYAPPVMQNFNGELPPPPPPSYSRSPNMGMQ